MLCQRCSERITMSTVWYVHGQRVCRECAKDLRQAPPLDMSHQIRTVEGMDQPITLRKYGELARLLKEAPPQICHCDDPGCDRWHDHGMRPYRIVR